MIHFRGRPAANWKSFEALCSTTAAPVTGTLTTDPRKCTCNACRRVLHLPHVREFEDNSDERHP